MSKNAPSLGEPRTIADLNGVDVSVLWIPDASCFELHADGHSYPLDLLAGKELAQSMLGQLNTWRESIDEYETSDDCMEDDE